MRAEVADALLHEGCRARERVAESGEDEIDVADAVGADLEAGDDDVVERVDQLVPFPRLWFFETEYDRQNVVGWPQFRISSRITPQ